MAQTGVCYKERYLVSKVVQCPVCQEIAFGAINHIQSITTSLGVKSQVLPYYPPLHIND